MQILSCKDEKIEETAAHELWMKALNLMATFIFHELEICETVGVIISNKGGMNDVSTNRF